MTAGVIGLEQITELQITKTETNANVYNQGKFLGFQIFSEFVNQKTTRNDGCE